jgi:hypothetical protein
LPLNPAVVAKNRQLHRQESLFPGSQKTTLRNTSTFLHNITLPVHRWFRFSAGFSAEWVESVIENFAGMVGQKSSILSPDQKPREIKGIRCGHFCGYHLITPNTTEYNSRMKSPIFTRVCGCMVLSGIDSERSAKPLFIGSIPIAASNKPSYHL